MTVSDIEICTIEVHYIVQALYSNTTGRIRVVIRIYYWKCSSGLSFFLIFIFVTEMLLEVPLSSSNF